MTKKKCQNFLFFTSFRNFVQNLSKPFVKYQLAWPQLGTQLSQNSAWAKATPAFIFMCVCFLCVFCQRQAYLSLTSYSEPFNQKTSFTVSLDAGWNLACNRLLLHSYSCVSVFCVFFLTRQAYLSLKSYSEPFNQRTSFTKWFPNKSKTGFENRKWNYPNRK